MLFTSLILRIFKNSEEIQRGTLAGTDDNEFYGDEKSVDTLWGAQGRIN